jgi:hypothetical protein
MLQKEARGRSTNYCLDPPIGWIKIENQINSEKLEQSEYSDFFYHIFFGLNYS